MIRQIIHIDEERCNGCGLCANACQEGAIGIVDGRAKLLRDDYCDGLGNCLPVCPTNAISFIKREAAAFDEAAVEANMKANAESENGAGTTNTRLAGNHISAGVTEAGTAEPKQGMERVSQDVREVWRRRFSEHHIKKKELTRSSILR